MVSSDFRLRSLRHIMSLLIHYVFIHSFCQFDKLSGGIAVQINTIFAFEDAQFFVAWALVAQVAILLGGLYVVTSCTNNPD